MVNLAVWDTPGMRESFMRLNEEAVARIRNDLLTANLHVLVDVASPPRRVRYQAEARLLNGRRVHWIVTGVPGLQGADLVRLADNQALLPVPALDIIPESVLITSEELVWP